MSNVNTKTKNSLETPASADLNSKESLKGKSLNPENDQDQTLENCNITSVTKIPTLREQMKSLSEDQAKIKQDISDLKSDLSDIKAILNNSEIKLKKTNSEPSAIAGEKKRIIEQTFIESDEKVGDANVIYADENVSKQKHSTPKKSFKNPAISSRKVIKTIPVVVENDDTPDINKQGLNNPNFKIALDLYNAKNYNAAISKLQEIIKSSRNKELVSASNYLAGEAYYGLKQYKEAIKHYKSVIKQGNNQKNDDAQIMIAESYIRSGEITEAKSAFKSLIDNYPNSEYLPRARKMLQQL